MLTLPIKKKWFDMIIENNPELKKLDEYREFNEYWGKRFATVLGFKNKKELDSYILSHISNRAFIFSETFEVKYQNGYSNYSPSYTAKVSLSIGCGKEKWGAVPGKLYYILKIHNIYNIKNLK